MPSEPVWNDALQAHFVTQDDGSMLCSRYVNGVSGPWEPYVTPQPVTALQSAPAPQPTAVMSMAQLVMPTAATPAPTAMAAGLAAMMGGGIAAGGDILGAIDLSDVQEAGRLIMPEGSVVIATITPDTILEKSKTQEDMIHLIMKIDYTIPPGGLPTEEYKGLQVHDNVVLTQAARWKFKNIARVCGLLDAAGARYIGDPGSAKSFHGKQVGFIGKHHEYNGRNSNKPLGNYEVPQLLLGQLQNVAAAQPQLTAAPMVAPAPVMAPPIGQPVAAQPQPPTNGFLQPMAMPQSAQPTAPYQPGAPGVMPMPDFPPAPIPGQ